MSTIVGRNSRILQGAMNLSAAMLSLLGKRVNTVTAAVLCIPASSKAMLNSIWKDMGVHP